MKRKLNIVIWVLLSLAVFLPYLLSSSYAVPNTDDFCIAEHMRINFGSQDSLFFGALRATNDFYDTWATAYPFWFMLFFFNPMNSSQHHFVLYRLVMPTIVALVIISIMIAIRGLCIYCFKLEKDSKSIPTLCLLTAITFLNTGIYQEVFYWFVGAIYAFECIAELLTVYFMIKHFLDVKSSWFSDIMMLLLGSMCAWSLISLSTIYLVYIMFVSNKLLYRKKKLTKYEIIAPIIYLISTFLMVIGPGNYARHSSIDSSGIHIIDAVVNAGYNLIRMLLPLISNPVVIILVVVCLIYGVRLGKTYHITTNVIIMSYVASLLCLIGILFPVALGYSSYAAPNRIWFVFNIHTVMLCVLNSIMTGAYLANKCSSAIAMNIKSLLSMLVVYILISGWYNNSPYFVTVNNLAKDKEIHYQWISALRQIETNDEQDVTIEVSGIPSSETIKPLGITDSPDYWVNQGVALYYEKDSISAK